MRLLLAAIVAYALIIVSISSIADLPGGWQIIAAIAAPLFIATFVLLVFNKGPMRRILLSQKKYVRMETEKGRTTRTNYEVSRALSFEDRRTSRMAHFLELQDGNILCLYGQYLYEFEPIDDDPELNQPRLFPTSGFSLVRSTRDGELLDIEVGSDVIDTTLVREPDNYGVISDLGIELEDGVISTGVPFDRLEVALKTPTQ